MAKENKRRLPEFECFAPVIWIFHRIREYISICPLYAKPFFQTTHMVLGRLEPPEYGQEIQAEKPHSLRNIAYTSLLGIADAEWVRRRIRANGEGNKMIQRLPAL